MTIRASVVEFANKGSLPSSDDAKESALKEQQDLLHAITPPVTAEEAKLLMQCFGPDDCFGLAWTLLHLVESARGEVPLPKERPPPSANLWLLELWDRAHRGDLT